MKKFVNRLRRIEGQVRGLQKLVENTQKCDETIVQFRAVQSALDSCFAELLNQHLHRCLLNKNQKDLKKIVSLLTKK